MFRGIKKPTNRTLRTEGLKRNYNSLCLEGEKRILSPRPFSAPPPKIRQRPTTEESRIKREPSSFSWINKSFHKVRKGSARKALKTRQVSFDYNFHRPGSGLASYLESLSSSSNSKTWEIFGRIPGEHEGEMRIQDPLDVENQPKERGTRESMLRKSPSELRIVLPSGENPQEGTLQVTDKLPSASSAPDHGSAPEDPAPDEAKVLEDDLPETELGRSVIQDHQNDDDLCLEDPDGLDGVLLGQSTDSEARKLQTEVDGRMLESMTSGHLDLSGLALPFFPLATLSADAANIHRLSLQDNCLVEIPESVLSHFGALTWLDLRYNRLIKLPSDIQCLRDLQVLLLQGNEFSSLPREVGFLNNLSTLQISDNPINYPPYEVIEGGTRNIVNFLRDSYHEELRERRSETEEPPLAKEPRDEEPLASSRSEVNDVIATGANQESAFNCDDRCSDEHQSQASFVSESTSENQVVDVDENFDGHSMERSPSWSSRDGISTHFCITGDHSLESGRDSLEPPPTPSSCLLTPNSDTAGPARYQLEMTKLQSLEKGEDVEDGSWKCQCFQTTTPLSNEKMMIIRRISDRNLKKQLLHNLVGSPRTQDGDSAEVLSFESPSRCDDSEDGGDSDSLCGDLGEGYRKPIWDDIEVNPENFNLQVVPMKCMELEAEVEVFGFNQKHRPKGPYLPGVRRRLSPSAERSSSSKSSEEALPKENQRKIQLPERRKPPIKRPKLVTAAEVMRKARLQRRKQREANAAARELAAMQRLRSQEVLKEWRDDYQKNKSGMQDVFDPSCFSSVVCQAPFALDGMNLTPRTRSKLPYLNQSRKAKEEEERDLLQLKQGVEECLQRLDENRQLQDEIAESSGHFKIEDDSPFTQTVVVVKQLNQLRKQIQRLHINRLI